MKNNIWFVGRGWLVMFGNAVAWWLLVAPFIKLIFVINLIIYENCCLCDRFLETSTHLLETKLKIVCVVV
jgi:hypothetical protein